ncbi:MAG: Ribonuclease [Planctomycetota bacterium]|jgi:ribonuclease R
MPLRFKGRILDHLAHKSYLPIYMNEIARQLRVAEEDEPAFGEAIRQLAEEEKLEIGKDEKIRLPRLGEEATGTIKITPRGFGFLKTDVLCREGDLFIPEGETKDAVSGDRVRVRVARRGDRWNRGFGATPSGARDDVFGRVVEVLERGQSRYAGTLVKRGREWLVEPDGRSIREPIVVRDPGAKNAKEGDKVVVEILLWPEEGALAEGVITEVLGEAGRPDVETQAVIATYMIREVFPPEAIEQAREAAVAFERATHAATAGGAWTDREDLTGRFIFTIDPPDAKDFDDAISIEQSETTGHWELGVHIADVAHFVTQDSALDEEARARATSVYLPRRTVPMLPETLSNGVCSLQEGVARFTLSAFITLDDEGKVVGQRLARTVIKSAKRLTYIEAQALIDGKLDIARQHAKTEPNYTPELIDALKRSDKLAKVILARRQAAGMIHLDLPEVELVYDDAGHVIDAVKEDSSFTHRLIEMFMVEANEAVARTFAGLDTPLLRRIHPDPTFGDIEEVRQFARLAKWRLPDEPTRKDLQALLEATRNSPASRAIHLSVLRCMSKAVYSPAIIGHYALASEHYAHFTSPIRRYPDLLVHRVVHSYLDITDNGQDSGGGKKRRALSRQLSEDPRVLTEAQLIELGHHTSDREVAAEAAEKDLRTFLVLQLLHEKHLGDEFDGTVTGIMPNGTVFVSIDRYLVDGAIPSRDMKGGDGRIDRWNRDQRSGRLIAGRSGASIGLGDRIVARITSIDLRGRQLNLEIARFGRAAITVESELPESGDSGAQFVGGKREYFEPRPRDGGKKGRTGRDKFGHKPGFKQGRRGRKG